MQVMGVILYALRSQSTGLRPPVQATPNAAGHISPAVATAVQGTVERVFDQCQQVSLHVSACFAAIMGS